MQSNFTSGVACRASTSASHYRAVERVIIAMRERLNEPLSLEDLASIAMISPYHFERIFRHTTGIPPGQFLGALRIEAAKRLLLTTNHSVTDVCFDVGYNSLGTFITRFTQLVGLPPHRLRCLANKIAASQVDLLEHFKSDPDKPDAGLCSLTGRVHTPKDFDGPIFIGLFPTPMPQCRPVGCSLLTAPGTYHMSRVRDGAYYLLAAAYPWSEFPRACFLGQSDDLRIFISGDPLLIKGGQTCRNSDVFLRTPKLTDPPILIALPLLLKEAAAVNGLEVGAAQTGGAVSPLAKAEVA